MLGYPRIRRYSPQGSENSFGADNQQGRFARFIEEINLKKEETAMLLPNVQLLNDMVNSMDGNWKVGRVFFYGSLAVLAVAVVALPFLP